MSDFTAKERQLLVKSLEAYSEEQLTGKFKAESGEQFYATMRLIERIKAA